MSVPRCTVERCILMLLWNPGDSDSSHSETGLGRPFLRWLSWVLSSPPPCHTVPTPISSSHVLPIARAVGGERTRGSQRRIYLASLVSVKSVPTTVKKYHRTAAAGSLQPKASILKCIGPHISPVWKASIGSCCDFHGLFCDSNDCFTRLLHLERENHPWKSG